MVFLRLKKMFSISLEIKCKRSLNNLYKIRDVSQIFLEVILVCKAQKNHRKRKNNFWNHLLNDGDDDRFNHRSYLQISGKKIYVKRGAKMK